MVTLVLPTGTGTLTEPPLPLNPSQLLAFDTTPAETAPYDTNKEAPLASVAEGLKVSAVI